MTQEEQTLLIEDLEANHVGKTFHTSNHNGIKQIESDWKILYFEFEENHWMGKGDIWVRVENVTEGTFCKGDTCSMPWSEVEHLLPAMTQNRYVISRHSHKGVEWFSPGSPYPNLDWCCGINKHLLSLPAFDNAIHVAKALKERPENQSPEMSIRIAKWDKDHWDFWEVTK